MMDPSKKKIVVKHASDFPPNYDFSPKLKKKPDGKMVKIEYSKLPSGEILETESPVSAEDIQLEMAQTGPKNEATAPAEATVIASTNADKKTKTAKDKKTEKTKPGKHSLSFGEGVSKPSNKDATPEPKTSQKEKSANTTNSVLKDSVPVETNKKSTDVLQDSGLSANKSNAEKYPAFYFQPGSADLSNKDEKKSQKAKKPQEKKKKSMGPATRILISLIVILVCGVVALTISGVNLKKQGKDLLTKMTPTKEVTTEALSATTTEEVTTEEVTTEEPEPDFNPHCVESTKPENLIASTAICVDGEVLEDKKSYKPKDEITFGLGTKYTEEPGIYTFRGNNFRNDPTYGLANMTEHKLDAVWSNQTGALSYGDASWSGSGWTGQPLMRKWTREQKQHMNMFDWAKEDDELVEVIYACMDGNIYFMDLKTGKYTRDTMSLGFTFKGAGALDPRGIPMMYVGAGYDSSNGKARVFIINLIDCSVMHTFGNEDPFTMRGGLSYFDSSALVDAETDTLIYPGENGVLYLMKLGTKYDEDKGTLSISPDHVTKWHYNGVRSSVGSYWLGMEDSAVVYKGYLFVMDNGGDFFCLNLNTLEIVWAQDSLDDSNGSPVLSIEDGKVYLYASTSFHLGWRSSTSATIPIWKVDAETGEIIWHTDYECMSLKDLSGGTQSTIAVGRDGLNDNIYVTVSRTGNVNNGTLACINKKDGKINWEHKAAYTWSSPVCVYNEEGEGSVLYCTSDGTMYLLDGITGTEQDSISISDGCIEASPAVYEDYAVVGIRACKIWGIHLK